MKELLTSLSAFKEVQLKAVKIEKEEVKQRRAHLPIAPPSKLKLQVSQRYLSPHTW